MRLRTTIQRVGTERWETNVSGRRRLEIERPLGLQHGQIKDKSPMTCTIGVVGIARIQKQITPASLG